MKAVCLTIVCVLACLSSTATSATAATAPTSGRALSTVMIPACRVMDTRVDSGPLAAGTAYNLFVRGSAIPASQGGQTDCGVPVEAEAVVLSVKVVNAANLGALKIYPKGFPTADHTMRFFAGSLGVVTEDEILAALCVQDDGSGGYEACPGRPGVFYSDLEVVSTSATDLVVDVIGYLYHDN